VQVRAKSLTDDEKVKEIAHLLAGENISVHALENARHLIKEAQEMIER